MLLLECLLYIYFNSSFQQRANNHRNKRDAIHATPTWPRPVRSDGENAKKQKYVGNNC